MTKYRGPQPDTSSFVCLATHTNPSDVKLTRIVRDLHHPRDRTNHHRNSYDYLYLHLAIPHRVIADLLTHRHIFCTTVCVRVRQPLRPCRSSRRSCAQRWEILTQRSRHRIIICLPHIIGKKALKLSQLNLKNLLHFFLSLRAVHHSRVLLSVGPYLETLAFFS